MGGLRGVATRLTLWLALLGGSLATGAGRHIHVDLVYRLLPKRLRLPASLLNTAAATLVCFAGVWGFFDHIAINSFGAKAEDTAGQKIADVANGVGDHFFLTRKQIGLDLRTLPHVLGGARYDRWMTGHAWNAWVDDGGFTDHYTAEQVASIKVPEETETHTPLVVSPDGSTTRGMLTHVLGLVFPFGLFAIGLRFILRALLTLSGHYKPDTEEAHEDFGRKVSDETDPHARSVKETV
jgi:TRAP-type C4-dicarboxylate transport system permease small subunit